MKRLLIEIQRWSKQRVPMCRERGCREQLSLFPVRKPIALFIARRHHDETGHRTRVRVSRFG